jgi:hypothetical protein
MPKSIHLVIGIFILQICIRLIFEIARDLDGGIGPVMGTVIFLSISLLILFGFFKKSRLAWQWGTILSFLNGFVLLICSMEVITHLFSAHVITLIGFINLLDSVFAFTIAGSLWKRSSLEYFGLVCPQCGKTTRKAADFFFKKAKCIACNLAW